ncbi:UDP-N-acetylmuramate--L-alanine ligase [Wolbachia pipientis]|uniref:UDP-N-acetylmuramate--L-alanine ligase n=1 Tax=Wolbachia pipientis TaxID=955 RepID=A0A1E7QJQ4_WOLPI|nr:UDP-N-acetylmuramate--L-alanine ligase [Wolbachia pipientis]OEY86695.1 UDP-N-acetylmuramate--L-alanine ligase [Wolbachia pipientis]
MHIIGIGGIGMSAIAAILYHLDYYVQGSDIRLNSNIERLKKLGIKVYAEHDAHNIDQAHTVIYSSAIKSDNVELIAAIEANKTVMHRSEILAKLMEGKYVIAVSGSSGKTTTTAMIASILDSAGIDATVIVGGILKAYKSNAKFGKDNVFLIEADESDGTMLKISANVAVVTSINGEHVDYYITLDNIKRSFCHFLRKADHAILSDSINIGYCEDNLTTFGLQDSNVKAINIRQHTNNVMFDVFYHGCSVSNVVLSNAIGMHKVINALAAISVAVKLGISEDNIKKGLYEFKGVDRRFAIIAEINGIKLIEDDAHHPDEINAAIAAARLVTVEKVLGIIEIFRFVRVYNFFDEFVKVFKLFDYIILTPIPDNNFIQGYDVTDIQEVLLNNGFKNVQILNDSMLIARFISDFASSGDVVLFIGDDGNVARLAQETVEKMQ